MTLTNQTKMAQTAVEKTAVEKAMASEKTEIEERRANLIVDYATVSPKSRLLN